MPKRKASRRMKRKGQSGVFNQIGSLGIGIAVLAIVLTIAFLVQAQAQDQIVSTQSINESDPASSTWTAAYNASQTMQNATADIPAWVPLIVIASIGAILLGLVALFRR